MTPDHQAYFCFTHQAVEPLSWLPHPDHLRVGPMTLAEAERWRDQPTTPWAAPVLPLEERAAVA